ncbi:MAG: DnaJ domain-containing protein [Anaerolineae bacterium]|nr:DnaJ domain-containing protein [Anaerolineae bacterium]
MDAGKNYYDVLQLSNTATSTEIRKAYRRLVREYHPDANQELATDQHFHELQEAYETLSDPLKRKKYDHWRAQNGLDKSSALSLHSVASHTVLRPNPNEQAYYVRLDVKPQANLPTTRLPLNLCLVVDRSTSMQGVRIQRIKEAIRHIIDKLQPQDALALVVFSDRAEIVIESQQGIDQRMAKSIVSTIQPRGGTEILQGLEAGLAEIMRNFNQNAVNHLILLTDGQTYGDEEACIQKAQWAGVNKIQFSAIGIGSDWNEDLLDSMASLSGGLSTYIDSPEKIKYVFEDTMQNLETVVARNLSMRLNLNSRVHLHEAYQITPQINRLDSRGDRIRLGSLSAGQQLTLLLEFRIRSLPLGENRLMRVTVEADMPGHNGHRPWQWLELHVDVKDTLNASIPEALTDVLSKLSVFKMQEKVSVDLKHGQVERASERLKIMATHLLNLGETNLANAALLEAGQLNQTRALSAQGRKQIRYGTRTLATS